MSFQHFRLGELAMTQPLPPHLLQHPQGPPSNNGQNHESSHFSGQLQNNTQNIHGHSSASNTSKAPYGSGDSDDGYTLVFPSLDAFHEWRAQEEEAKMVEFVKGDTHGSKAVPPRFKDHTKLVCARHSRSGRKKYVKKHPERVRKVPSRKLEGQGCMASISYKTYFDTEEVRACYISQHSHEIGLANLPFTRRGRKAAVQQERDRSKKHQRTNDGTADGGLDGSPSPSPISADSNAVAGPSAMHQGPEFNSAVSLIAPLPHPFPQSHHQPPTAPHQYSHHPYPPPHSHPFPGHTHTQAPDITNNLAVVHDRWERMSVLFHAIRDHARGFEYPMSSVAALESVLIRLYLESPVGAPPAGMVVQHQNGGNVQGQNGIQTDNIGGANGNPMNGVVVNGGAEDGS